MSWGGQVNNSLSQIPPPQVRRDGTKGHHALRWEGWLPLSGSIPSSALFLAGSSPHGVFIYEVNYEENFQGKHMESRTVQQG